MLLGGIPTMTCISTLMGNEKGIIVTILQFDDREPRGALPEEDLHEIDGRNSDECSKVTTRMDK